MSTRDADALAPMLSGDADRAWRSGFAEVPPEALTAEEAEAMVRLLRAADRSRRGAFALLPAIDPEAEAMADRFLAGQYASEGKRPLARRAEEPAPAASDDDEPTVFCCTPYDPETGLFENPPLGPEAWAKLCDLAGLDPQTGQSVVPAAPTARRTPTLPPRPPHWLCDHERARPAFDGDAARGLPAAEVRRRWPRFYGNCPDCGASLISYASMEHCHAGDW